MIGAQLFVVHVFHGIRNRVGDALPIHPVEAALFHPGGIPPPILPVVQPLLQI
jgi:hypothetical protein